MAASIIDRGRGPEISGTRVTIFRVMDFLRQQILTDEIAKELQITADELRLALEYIDANRLEVEKAYDALLRRREQQRAEAAASPLDPAELKQRIRLHGTPIHVGPSR